MGFLDKWFGVSKPEPEHAPIIIQPQHEAVDAPVQSAIVAPRRPAVDKAALKSAGLRNGMWVVKGGQVGILTGMGVDAVAEVTLAKADGTTKMMLDESDKPVAVRVMSRAEDLRQAYIEEIPESRRPDVDALRAMGYINASEAA